MGIELRGRDLTLDGGKRVELSYVAVNASGQTRGDTDFFTLTLPPEIKAHVEQTGLRILRRFDLPRGATSFAWPRTTSLERESEA